MHFVSASLAQQVCSVCGKPATHKIGEEHGSDDRRRIFHNLTNWLCCQHFRMVIGPAAVCGIEQ